MKIKHENIDLPLGLIHFAEGDIDDEKARDEKKGVYRQSSISDALADDVSRNDLHNIGITVSDPLLGKWIGVAEDDPQHAPETEAMYRRYPLVAVPRV